MIVLDTHVVIWRALDPEKIPPKTRTLLDREEKRGHLHICEITFFEIAMLMKRGRLNAGLTYDEFIELVMAAHSYETVGLSPDIAGLAVEFPDSVNKDPADRLILATAVQRRARLCTADRNLQTSGVVAIVW